MARWTARDLVFATIGIHEGPDITTRHLLVAMVGATVHCALFSNVMIATTFFTTVVTFSLPTCSCFWISRTHADVPRWTPGARRGLSSAGLFKWWGWGGMNIGVPVMSIVL